MGNSYSGDWYDTFLDTIPAASTDAEVTFIQRHLPPPKFPYLLDLCCGPARHAALLVARGYRILGLDANEQAIRQASVACPEGRFEAGDMRALASLGETFDGVLNLWHSFGYFDDETNRDVLRQVRDVLRPGGRAIFDIYNRDHFAQRPLVETAERGGRAIRTTRSWHGPRHRVVLQYDGQSGDTFEWRLYTPAEFEEVCRSVGLHSLHSCAWFDESITPSPEHARMQFVLERR